MTSMTLATPIFAHQPAADRSWSRHMIMLVVGWAVLLALFHRDALHLVTIWWTSSTFTHCLLILPVLGWLVWLRRPELAKLSPGAWWPGLIWLGGGAFAWLLGDAASVALLRQLGLVVMLQALVPCLLGPQVTRGVIFPLFYSFFLVPLGEELVPPMQTLTADMAMALLRITGIPAYIEGIFITTPAGYFAVAEACSGVKFLVAMAALAVLTAHLCFQSFARRTGFLVFALVVPILANGVRAFGTIWMAEQWGTQYAAGADHIIYGWFFFGSVIALIGAVAWCWFDRDPDAVPIDAGVLARFWPTPRRSLAIVALAAVLIAALPLGWTAILNARATAIAPLTIPQTPGWAIVQTDATTAAPAVVPWRARFDGADQTHHLTLAGPNGQRVDMTIAGYARQAEGREMVGYGQGAVDPDSDWRWGESLAPLGVARVDRIVANGVTRDAMTLYRVGDMLTASASAVKWQALKARLTGGDERAYAIILSATPAQGRSGRAHIADYVAASGGVDAMAARLTRPR